MAQTKRVAANFTVCGDIINASTDMLKCYIPNASSATVKFVSVGSQQAATGGEIIEVRSAAGGGGSAIQVTFSAGEYYASASGTLTLSDYLWVRAGSVVGSLADINVTIHYKPSES